jgi:hypothetical protein
MKKKILLLIPTTLLCFISSFILLVGIYSNGRNKTHILIAFIVSIFFNFLYYLWLATTKRIDTKLTIFYIPITFILFIFFIFAILNKFWIIRDIKFNMGPDPFEPSTTITSGRPFGIWHKEYWFKSAREEYRLKHLINIQTIRQGNLIKYVGIALQGWSYEQIKTTFGEPAKIIKMEKNLEKWIYHPWTNHPDWEMPVYVENEKLLKIGD